MVGKHNIRAGKLAPWLGTLPFLTENLGLFAGKMAQKLRALGILPEDPGSIPKIHTVALVTPSPRDPIPSDHVIWVFPHQS